MCGSERIIRPRMHAKHRINQTVLRQNWIAASLNTAGRPARPLDGACHGSSASSQTINDPRRLSAALYAGQFVVRYLARDGLLITSGYQVHVLGRSSEQELCNNAGLSTTNASTAKSSGVETSHIYDVVP
jgi:hypothetical protein